MRVCTVSSLALSMTVAGCSIHPLPKDVTRDTTLEIINKIRCEARGAIVDQIIDELEESVNDQDMMPGGSVRILDLLREDTSEEAFCSLPSYAGTLDSATHDRLNKYAKSSIAYKFIFKIDENKKKVGSAKFQLPFFKGMFDLGIDAGSDKTRLNERKIDLQDTFSSLVFGYYSDGTKTGLSCEIVSRPRKHWIYPITGNIGLYEVIDTYIETHNVTKSVSAFSDHLTYTTTFSVGAEPKVTLSRLIPKKLNPIEAKFEYDARRTDIHDVTITLSQDPEEEEVVTTEIIPPEKADISIFHDFKVMGEKKSGTERDFPDNIGLGLAIVRPRKPGKPLRKPVPHPCRALQVPDKIVKVFIPGRGIVTKKGFITKRGFVSGKGNPFAMTPQQEKTSLRRVREESERQDRLDTTRQLKDLIGK